jgi:hypothetical protein
LLQLNEAHHRPSVLDRRGLVDATRATSPRGRALAERHISQDTTQLVQLRLRIYDLDRTGQADQILSEYRRAGFPKGL